jgi:hypothetical protein
MAYFKEEISLGKMVNDIYRRTNVMHFEDHLNLFVKEIELCVDYLKNEIDNHTAVTPAILKQWNSYKANLLSGINYYEHLFSQKDSFDTTETTREITFLEIYHYLN